MLRLKWAYYQENMVYKHIGIALYKNKNDNFNYNSSYHNIISLSCIQVISYLHWTVLQNLLQTTVKFVWMRLKNQYFVQQATMAAVHNNVRVDSSTLMDLRLGFLMLVPIEAEVMVMSG